MEKYYSNDWTRPDAPSLESGPIASAFIRRVYTIMAIGLGLTALTAWLVAFQILPNNPGLDVQLKSGPLHWVIMLSPFAFILAINFGLHKMSYRTTTILFGAFAVVMGISLSWIFLVYSIGSIFKTFIITGATFGLMAFIGATTKVDLSKYRSILFMALIGLIIAGFVNLLMQSSTMDYIISFIGVIVFSGLTAYDVQNLMRIGAASGGQGNETTGKLATVGALSLYLNFINLFLFLLRFFGSSD